MRASIINKAPMDWLKGIGKSPTEAAEILGTYEKGAPLGVKMYRAKHTFLRFHGAKSKCPVYRPNFWADGSALGGAFGRASQFEGWLTEDEIRKIAKNYYREISAICHNWNPLADDTLWKIELRDAETVEGLEGPVAPQPTFAAQHGAPATTSMFRGSAIQVYLYPRTPVICTPVSWNSI